MSGLRVEYALGPGGVTRPEAAVKGGRYTCPCCGEDLILREGSKVRKHFSHRGDSACTGESVLHAVGKREVVECAKRGVLLTALCDGCGMWHDRYIPPGTFEGADLECRTASGHVLDVALISGGRHRLGVEVRVTHAVSDEKAASLPGWWIEVLAEDVVAHRRWVVVRGRLQSNLCRVCRAIPESERRRVDAVVAGTRPYRRGVVESQLYQELWDAAAESLWVTPWDMTSVVNSIELWERAYEGGKLASPEE